MTVEEMIDRSLKYEEVVILDGVAKLEDETEVPILILVAAGSFKGILKKALANILTVRKPEEYAGEEE